MSITPFRTLQDARQQAATHRLREKAVCFVTRGQDLLVMDHVPAGSAGVQLPAGGVEPGETPGQAATRELWEETGLTLPAPTYLTSYLWEAQLPDRFTRQVCHAFLFRAPPGTPDTWERDADGEHFAFRWMPALAPQLDWEMDAALPWAHAHLNPV